METKKLSKKEQNRIKAKREARAKTLAFALQIAILVLVNAAMIWFFFSLRMIDFAAPFGIYWQLPLIIVTGILTAASIALLVLSIVKKWDFSKICVTPVMLTGIFGYVFAIVASYDYIVKFVMWDYIAIVVMIILSLLYVLYQLYLRVFYK